MNLGSISAEYTAAIFKSEYGGIILLPLGTWVCVRPRLSVLYCLVQVEALQGDNPPSKESYQKHVAEISAEKANAQSWLKFLNTHTHLHIMNTVTVILFFLKGRMNPDVDVLSVTGDSNFTNICHLFQKLLSQKHRHHPTRFCPFGS